MDTKRLDLNLLVTLEALLVEQNVTRAAARLHLSQPAVSAQLSRLREVFDDPLLIPAHRGMTPTAKAMELLEPLRQSLDGVRATVTSHRSFVPAKAKMTVTVSCSDYPQAAIVIPLAMELRKKAPGVKLAVRNLEVAHVEPQMAKGDIDLGFMTPVIAPPSLRFRHLFDERYLLIGRKNHPRLRDGITLDEFLELEHVVVSPHGGGFVTPVDEALAAMGRRRNVVLSAASFLFVPEMISRSDFVALVPERLVRDGANRLTSIEPPLPVNGFSMGMVWHERSQGHPGHRWIRDTVVALVGARAEAKRGRSRIDGSHQRR